MVEQVDKGFAKMDYRIYRDHRKNVAEAAPKVDNHAPLFHLDVFYDQERLDSMARELHEVDQVNMELLRRINYICLTGGKVDCWTRLDAAKSKPIYLDSVKEETRRTVKENKYISKLIESTESNYPTEHFMKEWRKNEQRIIDQSKYPWTKARRFMTRRLSIEKMPSLSESSEKVARSRCFVDIELAEERRFLGRLIFELYSDYAPKTCANFAALCRGANGLSYKGTPFHRIVTGYWCQGGDVTKFNGSGGTSIYGDTFEDENFDLSHVDMGVLSMWSNGPNTNNSKFNLTFKRLEPMDKRRVVFGRVINGLQHVPTIEYYGTRYGKPLKKIIISNCGVLE